MKDYVFDEFMAIDKYLYDSEYNYSSILKQKFVVRDRGMNLLLTITFDENAASSNCVDASGPILEYAIEKADAKQIIELLIGYSNCGIPI